MRGKTVAPTTPPTIANAAAAATATASPVRRDRRCRFAAAWASDATLSGRASTGAAPARSVNATASSRLSTLRMSGIPASSVSSAASLRVRGEIVLVGTPILEAQRAEDVGGVPLGKVVVRVWSVTANPPFLQRNS